MEADKRWISDTEKLDLNRKKRYFIIICSIDQKDRTTIVKFSQIVIRKRDPEKLHKFLEIKKIPFLNNPCIKEEIIMEITEIF